MKLRVFILDQSEAMRRSLEMFVESLGHQVFTASSPANCPYYHAENVTCTQDHACGDALIIGQHFPTLDGIDFLRRRIEGGCKGIAANNAILCMPWSDKDRLKAEELGCTFFETPLKFSELQDWLCEISRKTPKNRKLMPIGRER